MTRGSIPLALSLVLAAAGCAGEVETTGGGQSDQRISLGPDSSSPAGDAGAPGGDTSTTSIDLSLADGGGVTLADTQPPQPDLPPGVGKACPCSGSLVCVSGKCRAKCNAPTDTCQVVSNCPSDHACLQIVGGPWACVPATASAGAACGTSTWCAVSYVCGSVGGSAYKCLPVCGTAGASCGTGGTCVSSSGGCTFCSST